MSNYPNMSYCMCENTLGAVQQILDAVQEDGGANFIRDLSRSELRAFHELLMACEELVRKGEEGLDAFDRGEFEEDVL